MSNLIIEILLRLIKPAAGAVLGGLVFVVATWLGAPSTIELALLAWVSAGIFILLVQESPL